MTDEILDANKHGVRPNVCEWPPQTMPHTDAEIYENMRRHLIRAHCAAGRNEHQCCGRITIDRKGMLLQCPLCGDLKAEGAGE